MLTNRVGRFYAGVMDALGLVEPDTGKRVAGLPIEMNALPVVVIDDLSRIMPSPVESVSIANYPSFSAAIGDFGVVILQNRSPRGFVLEAAWPEDGAPLIRVEFTDIAEPDVIQTAEIIPPLARGPVPSWRIERGSMAAAPDPNSPYLVSGGTNMFEIMGGIYLPPGRNVRFAADVADTNFRVNFRVREIPAP